MTEPYQDSIPTPNHTLIYIEKDRAYCNGLSASAHPGIYLALNAAGEAICPYCSQGFKRKDAPLSL